MTNATAKKYGLKSIADLKKVGSFKFAGVPGMQDPQHVPRRLQEAVRDRRTPTFVPLASISAYSLLDQGTVLAADVLLDRPAARQGLEVHRPRRPEARHRLPERGPDREDVGREGRRSDVHEHGQRGLGEADAERDRGDEQGVIVDKQSPTSIAKAFLKANGLA